MMVEVNGTNIETDVQGFLQHMEEWSEDFTKRIAERDDIKLYNDHWELIYYFREYYEEHMTNPTMHMLVKELGPKNKSHHEQKEYEKHIYRLFPRDPVHEICKLAGLPLPQPDD